MLTYLYTSYIGLQIYLFSSILVNGRLPVRVYHFKPDKNNKNSTPMSQKFQIFRSSSASIVNIGAILPRNRIVWYNRIILAKFKIFRLLSSIYECRFNVYEEAFG